MNNIRFKIFNSSEMPRDTDLESAINDWLDSNPEIALVNTETRLASSNGFHVVVVTIWYVPMQSAP